jgi:hypothetical protein
MNILNYHCSLKTIANIFYEHNCVIETSSLDDKVKPPKFHTKLKSKQTNLNQKTKKVK